MTQEDTEGSSSELRALSSVLSSSNTDGDFAFLAHGPTKQTSGDTRGFRLKSWAINRCHPFDLHMGWTNGQQVKQPAFTFLVFLPLEDFPAFR